MVARKEQRLKEFEKLLAEEGIKSVGYAADIADEGSFVRILENIVAAQDDIEVLHYNPSAYNPAPPSEISLPVFLSDLKINIVGGLLASQAVLPQLKARQSGAIFFTGGGH